MSAQKNETKRLRVHCPALTRLLVQNLERFDHLVRYALDNAHAGLRLLLKVAQIERHVAVLVPHLCSKNGKCKTFVIHPSIRKQRLFRRSLASRHSDLIILQSSDDSIHVVRRPDAVRFELPNFSRCKNNAKRTTPNAPPRRGRISTPRARSFTSS